LALSLSPDPSSSHKRHSSGYRQTSWVAVRSGHP
jgi:hypothetical protein